MALFKRKRRKLDIPPPPPTLDIPPPPEDFDLPELPDLPPLPEIMHEYETSGGFPENIPKHPDIKPFKEEHVPAKPILKSPESKRVEPPSEPDKEEEAEVKKKEIFLKVDHYKNVLQNINIVKQKINQSEKIVDRLNEIKNNKDKEFEKWRTLLEDMERKCIYIDKTFFEG